MAKYRIEVVVKQTIEADSWSQAEQVQEDLMEDIYNHRPFTLPTDIERLSIEEAE